MIVETLPPGFLLWLGAALLPLLPQRLRGPATILFPLLALVRVWGLTEGVHLSVPYLGQELVLCQSDGLRRVFGMIFALIAVLGGIYSLHVRSLGQQAASLLYAGGGLVVAFSGDWLTLFLGWEVMAVASACLIWARRTPEASAAGLRYVLVHLLGGSLLLAGICLQVAETGSLAVTAFAPGASAAAWLALAGVAVNVALPPLHAWLPDSYPKATATGSVFLSAFTTKTAVLVLALLFPGWGILVPLGVMMTLYGVTYAILANDIREVLAYHIVSQVGYMVAGVGIGTELGINGAAAHAYSHILYKALLFMGAGAVLETTGRTHMADLGGFARRSPAVLVLYMVAAFSISGVPLFNGFISKSAVVAAAAETHRTISVVLLLLASVGTFLSVGLKLPYLTWFGPDRGIRPTKPPPNMLVAMGITAFLCFLYGVWPDLLYRDLPYPMPYRPYTGAHLAEAIQLLLFTFLAFWWMRKKFAGERKISLDTDWLYRRPGAAAAGLAVGAVNALFGAGERFAEGAARGLAEAARNPAAVLGSRSSSPPPDPDRHRLPLGVSLALTLVALVVLAVWGLLRLGA
ncbi:MAG: Na(+)/H(+) antiporter subunit D [Deferrisomatales bacterium]|nr:Na(+)/H(+) antiporter subunit D [Deferrisomatales bacterium]